MLKTFPIYCKSTEKKGFAEFTSPLFFRFYPQNLWVGVLEGAIEELVLCSAGNIERKWYSLPERHHRALASHACTKRIESTA